MHATRSSRKDKKYMVRVNGRLIHFGAKYYDDYTTHGDDRRKANYLARHRNGNWADENTAGFWARWILWNKPTIAGSIKDINSRFNLNVRSHL